jgi:hypothetical protein
MAGIKTKKLITGRDSTNLDTKETIVMRYTFNLWKEE